MWGRFVSLAQPAPVVYAGAEEPMRKILARPRRL
jgi:hypothetical protein